MGIADDIKKTIQSKIVLRYRTGEFSNDFVTCIVCRSQFTLSGQLCLYIKGDGHVCDSCGVRFAPELTTALDRSISNSPQVSQPQQAPVSSTLTDLEWNDLFNTLESLQKISTDLARGISRGIIEAPAGHIGLLRYAKDILKPSRKIDESDKNYDLRVKGYRISKIFEKIKEETVGRIDLIGHYLKKLGMPDSTGR
jgi:hypothetical protein